MLKFAIKLLFLPVMVYCAVHLPPEITKCKRSDSSFSECMKKSIPQTLKVFMNGYPDFGFPPIEPFRMEKMELIGDPTKSVRLDQKYEQIQMHGMSIAEVKNFKGTDDGKTCLWEMEIYNPQSRMEANYNLNGQILIFPINGHGRCNVTMSGITNYHRATCEHYKKKGKSHLRMIDYTMEMKVEKCQFDFPGIIPGNEQISNELGKTINENALDIFNDVRPGFQRIFAKLHLNAANSIFSKIPEDDLFID